MREIKFRAKRTDGHPLFWSVGFLVKTPITTEFNCDGQFLDTGIGRWCIVQDRCAHEIDIATLGQFTGLLDKNGKEIYEGDIVKWMTINMEGNACIDFKNGGFYLQKTGFIVGDNDLEMEIIGNIYENSELLK